MDTPTTDFVRAGSLEELKAKGRLLVHGPHRPVLVVHDKGRVFALDNRCPHMGFPLDRGSVEDGTLTCHWHHARFVLAVLGGLAEFERELIRARTGEGRKRAKARGVKFGRPRKMTPHQRQEALQRLAAGETMADVARTYAVDATTIGRLAASSPFEQSAVAL
jgi:hypothetical protein